jgi:hypothetical protein
MKEPNIKWLQHKIKLLQLATLLSIHTSNNDNDLVRGPLSLVSTTEELLGRNSSGSGLEIREYGCRDSSRWPRGTLYPQKSWH